jgi:hypothetical protein
MRVEERSTAAARATWPLGFALTPTTKVARSFVTFMPTFRATTYLPKHYYELRPTRASILIVAQTATTFTMAISPQMYGIITSQVLKTVC